MQPTDPSKERAHVHTPSHSGYSTTHIRAHTRRPPSGHNSWQQQGRRARVANIGQSSQAVGGLSPSEGLVSQNHPARPLLGRRDVGRGSTTTRAFELHASPRWSLQELWRPSSDLG